MRTKLISAVAIVVAVFLLVTNPVVVNAAGKITGKDIKDNSVSGKDIKDGSLLSGDFGAGQIPAGPQGPQGPQGVQGVQGVVGPAGPSGPIKSQNTPMTAIPADAVGVFGFVGTPTTLTLTSPARLIHSVAGTFHTAAGTTTVVVDLCTQVGSAALVSASGGGYHLVSVDTTRRAYPVSGTSGVLAAGTYNVGYCAAAAGAAIPADGLNNWVSGWVQVVPSTSVSKPEGQAPRPLG